MASSQWPLVVVDIVINYFWLLFFGSTSLSVAVWQILPNKANTEHFLAAYLMIRKENGNTYHCESARRRQSCSAA